MNILEQYKQAVAKRGGRTMYGVTTHGELEIGEEFEFGGASWQKVGDTVELCNGSTFSAGYGYAKIISIDAGGFKTARRTR